MTKLNSMRLLDQHKIDYKLYEFDEAIHSADGVADQFGLPYEQVYKTLVTLPTDGKPMLVMVAANRQVDLKLLARAVGQKKVQMASHNEAEALTGLQTGGISALALLHKSFAVYLDKTALAHERIVISAGRRGLNLELPVQDLIRLTGAELIEATS